MTGCHLDIQPTGGKFDGAYGLMAGLELVRTLIIPRNAVPTQNYRELRQACEE